MIPNLNVPISSLESFQAYKLAAPEVAWVNYEISSKSEILDNAICLPLEGDDLASYTREKFTLEAERYGGRGVGVNGGGVRCGNHNKFQIKGVGKNPLVGRHMDIWHAHGGCNVVEGIFEAFWSEVCHKALPYGSVRTAGLIYTNTHTIAKTARGINPSKRILIIRDRCVRPAHFIRAANYDAIVDAWNDDYKDSKRTREAIIYLTSSITSLVSNPKDFHLKSIAVNQFIFSMANRFAHQIASARAKRIPHGSLNCSNISVDGRYVDFGTMTSVPSFSRLKVAVGGADSWQDEVPLYKSLSSLIFFLKKYGSADITKDLISPEISIQWLKRLLSGHLQNEFLKLTGIPGNALHNIPSAIRDRLWFFLLRIISTTGQSPSYIHLAEIHSQGNLSKILSISAASRNLDKLFNSLSSQIPDENVRAGFVHAFFSFRKFYLENNFSGYSSDLLLLKAGLNSWRLNSDNAKWSRDLSQTWIPHKKLIQNDLLCLQSVLDKNVKQAQSLLVDTDCCGQTIVNWLMPGGGDQKLDASSISYKDLALMSPECFKKIWEANS